MEGRMAKDVLLLHGLSKSPHIMADMERFLAHKGYHCHNIGYDSMKLSIFECAQSVLARLQKSRLGREEIILDVVAHSLGGLVSLLLISQLCPTENWGRVVLLGTPIQGSLLAQQLSQFWLYRRWYGKAGVEVGNYGKTLDPIDNQCGVIAGTASSIPDRLFAGWLGWEGHDGKILAAETKIDNMTDYLEFPATHPQLPKVPGIMLQTLSFLKTGHFCQATEAEPVANSRL
jgi:pimeloyl-ACP methyl ester carboxylesterase